MSRPPNFVALATVHRKFYSHCEEAAAKLPTSPQLDHEERASAEVVTFLIAACLAAHEYGLPRDKLASVFKSCVRDIWDGVGG